MAQKVTVTLVDDTSGHEADETVAFGLDGTNYEIDLTDKNAAALRKALRPYVEAGRVVKRKRGPRKVAAVKATPKARPRRKVSTMEDVEKAKQDA